tara:strand:+ start:6619 stop:7554 length:936 start_codon:yes stop_codon:yes gene_type:complete
MKNFILIGSAGYIAPRHFVSIKETKNNLLASFDLNDSAGVIDSFFPKSKFFTSFERFERFASKEGNENIDYLTVCSPNFLHDSHIRFGLNLGLNVICEKPIVLNPWNLENIIASEEKSGKKVSTILQLRYHDSILKLKNKIKNQKNKKFDVDLTYITARGNWYFNSWKGDIEKSGGLSTNIGVHFFDLLYFLFGDFKESKVFFRSKKKESGYIELDKARVRWFLSVDEKDLKFISKIEDAKTFRSFTCDGDQIEFSNNSDELHINSYKDILNNKGFGINDVKDSIKIVSSIRNAKITKSNQFAHPLLKNFE